MKKPGLLQVFISLCVSLSFFTASAQWETFTKRTVISGLNTAWEVVYGPNDSLWITENKAYLISRVNIANGAKTVLVDLRATDPSINFTSGSGTQPQGGLMGLALHPNLYSSDPVVRAAKPWVYAAYVYERNSCPGTNTSCVFTTKIVRFTYNGNTLSSPVIVLDNIPGSSDHNSGRLIIGPDIEPGSDADHTQYRLYYTVGDMGAGQFLNSTRAENAQNVDIMEGKVLRINTDDDGDAGLDAWVPNDNPFYTAGAITPRDYVYTLGHRNAQGLVWGWANGANVLYSSEQQDRSDDEINIIEPGKNYGWDKVTGRCDGNVNGFKIGQTTSADEQAFCSVPSNNYREPIYATFSTAAAQMAALYAEPNNNLWPTIASSSIDFYGQTSIPGWNQSLLISSLKQDKVYRIKPNSAGTGVLTFPTGKDTISYFEGDGNRIRRITIAPNGVKFYVARDAAANIMEYTYTGIILSSRFLSFEGKLISSGVAKLTWDAVTDREHDYFEVERSADGFTFLSMGRSAGSSPYNYIDKSVQEGNNYYKIKQVNKDGKITYSTTIKIIYDPSKAVITSYPNPVSDYLNIRISSAKKAQISITLTDIEGKVMHRQSDIFEPGIKDIKIDVKTMPAQVYIMHIINNNGEILTTEKILKLK
jgi:PQQ-dependent dehydrogenase (s-GDH family)